jgi:hypothetical protein
LSGIVSNEPYFSIPAQWRPNFDPEQDKLQCYLSRLAAFLSIFSVSTPIILTMHFILYPNSNIYLLLSWIPSSLRNYWLTVVLYGGFWFWIQLACWSAIIISLIFMASYAVVIIPLVYVELVKGRKSYKTNSSLRWGQNLALEYRKLEVLHLNLNDAFGWLILPQGALIGDAILFCNYALISIGDELDGITATVLVTFAAGLMIIWVSVLEAGGVFHKQAIELQESWKYSKWTTKGETLFMKKFRKSCRPLGIRCGGVFCVKRLTGQEFVQGIVSGTLRILLAT